MRPEDRRRFGAVTALVLGVFLGLTLLPAVPTGPLGRGLGSFLWRGLGAGALGLPLLGLGLGLAGFDRLPRLDMKRAAILLGGLALLVPFTLGVLTNVTAAGFDPPLPDWDWPARLTGLAPGFASRGVVELIGQPGGMLLAFLALTGLTLATLAWHPLHRLERKADQSVGRTGGLPAVPIDSTEEAEEEETAGVFPGLKAKLARTREQKQKPARPPERPAARPPGDGMLPPIDLREAPPAQDRAADSA
ncbi:MAG TPA: hypothetical protein VL241_07290, partial [Gemmatimonadales bacterium]|nr:hypothetical protein [Gemmatimonadales bacterium]